MTAIPSSASANACRPVSQQIAHWARLGRELEMPPGAVSGYM
ncbi:ParD-like family protein [Garicola koreensis]